MRGWMLAGVRRSPGPLIGTVVASAAAAALTVAALSVALADTSAPAGRGGPTSSWPRRGWGWAAASCGGGPPNSPAASSSGWRSPGR